MARTVDEERTFWWTGAAGAGPIRGSRRPCGPNWWRNSWTPAVRSATFAAGNDLEVRQRGNPVTDAATVRGPVRLALRSTS